MLELGLLWEKDSWMGCSKEGYKAKLVISVRAKC